MIWLLLNGCSGSAVPLQANLAEYERCQENAECGAGLQCLDSHLDALGPQDVAGGECRRDQATHRATVDTLHATLASAREAAAAAPETLPLSCPTLDETGNHYVVESNWILGTARGDAQVPHYIAAGLPSEFNGRLGPSAQMSTSDLVGCGRQTQWVLAKRYLAVSVEDELLFPQMDHKNLTYVPGHVKARVYLYDLETQSVVCGGQVFSGVAERSTTPSPSGDLQDSARESLKAALAKLAPGMTFYI